MVGYTYDEVFICRQRGLTKEAPHYNPKFLLMGGLHDDVLERLELEEKNHYEESFNV